MKRVTLKAISERVGVSPVAVSAALGILSENSQVRISEDKAKHIRKVAREMGYHTNRLARAFRTRQTHTIGVLFRVVSNPQPVSYLIDCIHRGLDAQGYQAYLSPFHSSFDLLEKGVRRLVEWQVDGIVMSHVFQSDDTKNAWPELEAWLEKVGVPLVMVESALKTSPRCRRFNVDMQGAATEAAEYLIRSGRRSIAYVGESRGANAERWQAVKAVADDAGVASQWIRVDETEEISPLLQLVESARETGRKLAIQPDRPTGLICCNDAVATSVSAGLMSQGVDVPGDVAVIGYDNSEAALMGTPQLTTFQQPIETVADAVIETLLNDINGKKSRRASHVYKAKMVHRDSA